MNFKIVKTIFLVLLVFALMPLKAVAASEFVTFEGFLADKVSGIGIDGSLKSFQFIITDSSGCALYREAQDLTPVKGHFAAKVGQGTKVFPAGALNFSDLFTKSSGLSGEACSPSGLSNSRILKVYVSDSGYELIGQYELGSAVHAFVATESLSLQGYDKDKVLKFDSATTTSEMTSSQYNELVALLLGTSTLYAKSGSGGTLYIPQKSSPPTTPAAGDFWMQSGTVKVFDGTATRTVLTDTSTLDFLKLKTCADGEILVMSGGVWICQVPAAGVSSVAATLPLVSSGGSTPTLSINEASGSVGGIVTTGTQTFAGDKTFSGNMTVTGTLTAAASDTKALQGKSISNVSPGDGEVLTFNSSGNKWEPKPAASGGISSVVSVSAGSFAVDSSHNHALLDVVNPNSVLSLPSAAAVGSGYEVLVAGPNSGSVFLKINAQGGDVIGNSPNLTLFDINASVRLVSTGVRWIPLSMVGGALGSGALGVLDTSFNGFGYMTYGSSSLYHIDSIMDNNGKFVVLINDNSQIKILRFNSDGTLDGTFGTLGVYQFSDVNIQSCYGSALTIDSAGKIIAVADCSDTSAVWSRLILRLTSSGILDSGFNTNGFLLDPTPDRYFYSVAVDASDKIYVGGSEYNGTDNDLIVLRFTTAGLLDTSFGSGTGTFLYNEPHYSSANRLLIDSSGKVTAMTGNYWDGSNSSTLLIRMNSNGTIDSSFGTSGALSVALPGATSQGTSAMTLDSSGRLLLTGYINTGSGMDLFVARLLANGSGLDTSFASTGVISHNNAAGGNSSDSGNGIVIEPSGKILIVGESYNGSNSDMVIWRLDANGQLDTSFSQDGFLVHNGVLGGNSQEYGKKVFYDSNGRMVVIGSASDASWTKLAFWRIK